VWRSRVGVVTRQVVVTSPGIDGQGWSPEVTAEQFQLLVEQVKDYAIFLLDPEGRVASWNRGAERITGYSAAEILGRHFACFYPPENAAAGKPAKALASATRTGRYQERGWRVRKDGERYYAHDSITALLDGHGEPRGFAKITRDSTGDLQAERTLREREQQLAEAQAVAKLGSFEWDLTTDRVTWSPELARICGLHPASSSASLDGFLRQIHPDDRAAVTETVRHAAATGMPFRLEGRVVRPTGEPRLVASWGEVARNEQGRPWRVLGVCQDVTELRQREERLAEANAREELSRRLQSGLLPTSPATAPTRRRSASPSGPPGGRWCSPATARVSCSTASTRCWSVSGRRWRSSPPCAARGSAPTATGSRWPSPGTRRRC
jgi:PAS domain S-box-containing protein